MTTNELLESGFADCVISFQATENGCPITGRWVLGEVSGGHWEFTPDGCAAEWGLSDEEIAATKTLCRRLTVAHNGIADPREIVRSLRRSYDQQAEVA